ncbi:hypothetical protein [Streptomyces sp. LaPpAH-108]|uniref:hypothetical protein n=1 Tax=Streptomyces sp. LaPpAH-108 TaxID=1155714 RepID=UPI00037FCCA5|nr:hypothetical protein [Streptomyces sp. LaPpAH-108]
MSHDTHTDPTDTGLTTEDLAHPERRAAPESPPAYPGEGTATRDGRDGRGTTEGQAPGGQAERTPEPDAEPLIEPKEAEDYRERWTRIQGTFVDDPKDAVHSADALVAEVIQSLAETFADHKKELESQWSRGQEVETEGLRVALQQYRTFFNKLLHA